MSVQVSIIDGPIAPLPLATGGPGAGAVITFDGVVRPLEHGRQLVGLRYETYEPMAANLMRDIANTLVKQHGLLGLSACHSRGFVPVGATSMRIEVLSAHRKEAIAALDEFIDRLKRDVPIWKHPVWTEAC